MKMKEIILFLLILSFVMNGLVALRVTQTSYSNEDIDVDSAMLNLQTHIASVFIAGIGTAVAVGMISNRAGIPGDKSFAYGLLGGIISTTLIGGVGTLTNIYRALPENATTGYAIILSVFLAVLVVLISWVYIEGILGVRLE